MDYLKVVGCLLILHFIVRKVFMKKYGLYNESYKIAGDFELMMRFLEKYKIRSKYIPKKIVNMRVGKVTIDLL